jgi:hypothetical protein
MRRERQAEAEAATCTCTSDVCIGDDNCMAFNRIELSQRLIRTLALLAFSLDIVHNRDGMFQRNSQTYVET